MTTIELGYIIASHEVTEQAKKVGYLYREEPDGPEDSGWRVFSGDESQDYADEPSNFSMYNASTIVGLDPAVASILDSPAPVAFRRVANTDQFEEEAESS